MVVRIIFLFGFLHIHFCCNRMLLRSGRDAAAAMASKARFARPVNRCTELLELYEEPDMLDNRLEAEGL